MPSANTVVGMVVIMLFLSIAFPLLVTGAESGDAERIVTITGSEGATTDVEDALIITVEDSGPNMVGIRITSKPTGNNTTASLSVGETASLTLDNETVTATALSIEDEVTLRVIYPADFAWGPRPQMLAEQLPIIFAGAAMLIIIGFVGVMV